MSDISSRGLDGEKGRHSGALFSSPKRTWTKWTQKTTQWEQFSAESRFSLTSRTVKSGIVFYILSKFLLIPLNWYFRFFSYLKSFLWNKKLREIQEFVPCRGLLTLIRESVVCQKNPECASGIRSLTYFGLGNILLLRIFFGHNQQQTKQREHNGDRFLGPRDEAHPSSVGCLKGMLFCQKQTFNLEN